MVYVHARRLGTALAGAAFTVLGLAAQSSNMTLVSTVPYSGCTTGDVWAMGHYVLLARRWQGFAIVDVADPANPVAKTILPPGYPVSSSSYGVGDIKADGRYIYATDEGTGKGLFIYDMVPDPMNPKLVSTLSSTGRVSRVHNCWVDGDLLYAQELLFDIRDRANPKYLTRITASFAHDSIAIGGRAYLSLWDRGIAIYDMATPSQPRLLGATNYSGSATHNMWPTEDGKYLFTTDEVPGGHVRVWDIQNAGAMFQVGSWRTGPTDSVVHNVQVNGNLLFVSYYKEGVHVLSIADPKNPVEIAYYDTYPSTGGGCFGGSLYAGCWGVYPWDRDHVFVSDMDSGGYVLALDPIAQSFSAGSASVPPGNTIDLSFSFRNDAPAPLDAFGLMLLDNINGSPALWAFVTDLQNLAPGQQVGHKVSIPVPAGFPLNTAVGFSGYTGLTGPLLLSERQAVSVTIR